MKDGYWVFVEKGKNQSEKFELSSLDNLLEADQSTDSKRLFRAILYSITNKFPLSESVLHELTRRYAYWTSGSCRTLDEAFDLKRPKGFNLKKYWKDVRVMSAAFCMVEKLHTQDVPLEKAFIEVGKKLEISDSSVSDYYYLIKDRSPEEQEIERKIYRYTCEIAKLIPEEFSDPLFAHLKYYKD